MKEGREASPGQEGGDSAFTIKSDVPRGVDGQRSSARAVAAPRKQRVGARVRARCSTRLSLPHRHPARTGANRGETPGTDSVPSASGGPADPSGEELTVLRRGTASFSLQKQLPPGALFPPCHWPDAGGGVVTGGAAGSTVSGLQHRGPSPTAEQRAQ